DPQPAAIALADLRELGKKIIADVSAETLRPILSTDLIGEFERVRALPHNRRDPTTARIRPGFSAPVRSVTAAVAVSTAVHVLLHQPESQRHDHSLRWLFQQRRSDETITSRYAPDQVSPTLLAVQQASLTAQPSSSRGVTACSPDRIPALLWPEWF